MLLLWTAGFHQPANCQQGVKHEKPDASRHTRSNNDHETISITVAPITDWRSIFNNNTRNTDTTSVWSFSGLIINECVKLQEHVLRQHQQQNSVLFQRLHFKRVSSPINGTASSPAALTGSEATRPSAPIKLKSTVSTQKEPLWFLLIANAHWPWSQQATTNVNIKNTSRIFPSFLPSFVSSLPRAECFSLNCRHRDSVTVSVCSLRLGELQLCVYVCMSVCKCVYVCVWWRKTNVDSSHWQHPDDIQKQCDESKDQHKLHTVVHTASQQIILCYSHDTIWSWRIYFEKKTLFPC